MSLVERTFPDDPDQLRAMLASVSAERDEARVEVDKLQLLISELQRMQFGRRSEQCDPDQMRLGLEDQEQAKGEDEAAEDAGSSDADRQGKRRAKPKRNRGHLPKHLPRIERIIEPQLPGL